MKKTLFMFLTIALCISVDSRDSISASANTIKDDAVMIQEENLLRLTRADIIVYEFREHFDESRGKLVLQYRRWNTTMKRWEDPDWITYGIIGD